MALKGSYLSLPSDTCRAENSQVQLNGSQVEERLITGA
jgi:hypothetical protein